METKWIIAGGVAVAAAIGGVIWLVVSSPGSDDMLKMNLEVDKKKFYDIGFKEGSAQGSTDRGKAHDPLITLNMAETSLPKGTIATYVRDVQQSYENGVNDGYERFWTGPTPVIVTTTMDVPATPKAGGIRPGESAYDYGFRRGKSTGYNDGYNADIPGAESYLATDGSKQRQIESGNPAEYRRGYKDGYASGIGAGASAKALEEVLPTSTSGTPRSIGTLLSVGYEPHSGALLKVGGVQVLGLRPMYVPPQMILARRMMAPAPLVCAPPAGPGPDADAFRFGWIRARNFVNGDTPSSSSAEAAVADSDIDRDGPHKGWSAALIGRMKANIRRGYACGLAAARGQMPMLAQRGA